MRMILVLFATLLPLGSLARAQQSTCDDLWFQRNLVYKIAGYCFQTARGLQHFDNGGCRYSDVARVPLTPVQHRIVAEVLAQERAVGCR